MILRPELLLTNLLQTTIEEFVKSILEHDENDEVNPKLIEKAMKGLRINMKIESPEARALQYVTDAFSRLERVGYGKFREIYPRKTIELLQQNSFSVAISKRFEEGSQEIYIIPGGQNCFTGQELS